MEVLIDEPKKEVWLERSAKSKLILAIACLMIFQIFKYNESFQAFYKTLYFSHISPFMIAINSHVGRLYLVFIVVVLINLIYKLYKKSLKSRLNVLIRFFCLLFIGFFALWGFNYSKSDLIVNSTPESNELIFNISLENAEELAALDNPNRYSLSSLSIVKKENLNFLLRRTSRELFPMLKHEPQPKSVNQKGLLRKIGISGIFFPFSHEPLYDDSAPWVTKQFTYCHEYFHAVSVTGEDECNALAFYALVKSNNSEEKLSAYLDVLRTSANALGYSREDLKNKVSQNVAKLLEFIWMDADNYVTRFHSVSHASNDLYLKSLGTEEGVAAYNGYLKFLKIENGEISLYLK